LENHFASADGYCGIRRKRFRRCAMCVGGFEMTMTVGLGVVFAILAVSGLVRLVLDILDIRERFKTDTN
jgi:hypothetical protein